MDHPTLQLFLQSNSNVFLASSGEFKSYKPSLPSLDCFYSLSIFLQSFSVGITSPPCTRSSLDSRNLFTLLIFPIARCCMMEWQRLNKSTNKTRLGWRETLGSSAPRIRHQNLIGKSRLHTRMDYKAQLIIPLVINLQLNTRDLSDVILLMRW